MNLLPLVVASFAIVYLIVLGMLLSSEWWIIKRSPSNIIWILLWPLAFLVGMVTRPLFKRWKYEYREPIGKEKDFFGGTGKGLWLRPGRNVNDGFKEMLVWIGKKLTGRI